nr:hypothetical protein [Tanacetum cinerariifolium]
MTSLANKAILLGADNHPSMLEKDIYDSWKSRMELYMLNRQHGMMILELVEQGPLLWPTVEEDEVTRLKKYSELSAAEAIQADCDVKETNIILSGNENSTMNLIKSTSGDDQNINPSVSETVASPITPKPLIKFVKPKDSQSKSKTGKTESPKKPPVKYAEQYRKPNKKPNVRGNQRNYNNLKSHQLGPDFVMKKKECFNCGDLNHLAYDCRKRVKKSFSPKHVVNRPYRPSQRPVKTNMNGIRPNRTSFNKQAHSYANRPSHRTSAVRSHYRAPWVPTVNRSFSPVNRKLSTGSRNFPTANRKFPTASIKFPTASTKCSTSDMGMKGKAVKPSACYWDSGCSRHMTCNISYLSDYEPFDGGYVSFSQRGCKITRKGTIKTGKLEFENVYFVKDLKTPRQHNMYSIDLNNIVPHRDLTCLVAKASADECML